MGAGVAAGPRCLGRASPHPKVGIRPPSGFGRAVEALTLRRLPGSLPRPKPRTVRRGARPEGPAGAAETRRLEGNSVGLRFRSALPGGSRLAPLASRPAAAPSSRPAPRFSRRFPGGTGLVGSGLAGSGGGVAALAFPRRASAEAAASAWPWLAPGCRCRGGFVSRPALRVPAPKDLPAPAVAGEASGPFCETGRLWPRTESDSESDSAKAESGCG